MTRQVFRSYVRLALAVCALTTLSAQADVITDLFNTGVDASGTPLGASVADPHYTLISQPGTSYTATTVPEGYPIGPWVANDSNSRWIGPNTYQAQGSVGYYTYRTTFTLGAMTDLGSVSITGRWATDDPGTSLRINGVSTGEYSPSLSAYDYFSISSNFVIGVNTLDFVIYNYGGPTGLRVDDMVGTFTTVPAPASLALMLLGLMALTGSRLQRSRG
ncbi:MAG: PEP-CTERM sorting domain-containing protein [Pseudomonadota bacterium]